MANMRTAAVLLGVVAVVTPVSPTARGQGVARVAHSLSATDTARLHLVKSSGAAVVEEGRAAGTLPGTLRAYLNVGATVTASFTIYVKGGGSLKGQGSGRLKGRASEPSYGGTMTITGGTGRYSHARGRGGFYGTLNRSSYALVVQTTGTLSY